MGTSDVYHTSPPIGVYKLNSIMKNMCKNAEFERNFSNHSGKRTCATSLYHAGFDEQMIMERTGHRSTAVRAYKRPSEHQQVEISRTLECGKAMPKRLKRKPNIRKSKK
ncbi:uncharacterized protein [Argopecten irradians]|uniref:uncharacterized protein n=1 Tax=Argopecten irradians TaxID=31199 RepID=UPI00371DB7D7